MQKHSQTYLEPCCHYMCDELIMKSLALYNVLTKSIKLTLTLEAKMGWVLDVLYILDAFDAKVPIFQNKMWVKVVKEIEPFL